MSLVDLRDEYWLAIEEERRTSLSFFGGPKLKISLELCWHLLTRRPLYPPLVNV